MANFISKAWGKYVKDPLNKAGNAISKATQSVTDKIGLSTPDIPEGSRPVVDQAKIQDLAQYQGVNRENIGRWKGQTPGGPGYFAPQTFTPTQARDVATPTMPNEQPLTYDPQMSAAPTEQSLAPLALQRFGGQVPNEGQTPLGLSRVAGNNPDNSQFQTAASQALQERIGTQAPTTAGFDPARKQMALEQMTAGLDTQQKDAEANLTEQLSKAGILNSSVGQAELAKVRQGYAQQKANALTQVNLEDLAAQRTDRYANADQASQRLNQITNMAGSGQGLGIQGAQFKTGLTAQDNATIQAEAQDLMQKRGIDRATAMQEATANNAAKMDEANYGRQGRQIDQQTAASLAQQNFGNQMTTEGYNRQGRQMGTANDWQRYNADVTDASNRANLSNQAKMYNMGSIDQSRQNEAGSYRQDLQNLAAGSSGSMYTPQSEAAAADYAAKQALQSQRLGTTLQLAGTLAQTAAGVPPIPKRTASNATPLQPAVPVKNVQAPLLRRPTRRY